MYLLIDTSEKDIIALTAFDKDFIEHKKYSGQNRELLACINDLIKEIKPAGIMVVVGVGGFTSTRIACVVANTFGYVLQIPLLAVTLEESKEPQKLIAKLLSQPVGQYISAIYSGEANIGKKKND